MNEPKNDMAKIARLVADPHADETAALRARNEVLEAGARHWNGVYKIILDEREALRARVAKLEEVLKECADDLEAEFLHRYKLNDGTIHPAQQRDFDRDMDLVVRARAALKDAPQ